MALHEEWDSPYIAVLRAVPGQATGPHIHIGPPSLRIDAETMSEKLKELDELLGIEPQAPAPEQ